jgi:hypothetical protein
MPNQATAVCEDCAMLPFMRSIVPTVFVTCVLAVACRGDEPKMLEGLVVSSGSKALVVRDLEGRQLTFQVDAMTKVTIHGKPGKIEELKAGMPVRLAAGPELRLLAVSTIDDEKSLPANNP